MRDNADDRIGVKFTWLLSKSESNIEFDVIVDSMIYQTIHTLNNDDNQQPSSQLWLHSSVRFMSLMSFYKFAAEILHCVKVSKYHFLVCLCLVFVVSGKQVNFIDLTRLERH